MDSEDDIMMAFDTSNEDIIVSSPDEMNGFNGNDGVHSAYEDLKYAPVIQFEMEDGKIIDAWV